MIAPLPKLPNVLYDGASAYPWSRLNETAFLEAMFRELAVQLDGAFAQHTFYVLSSHDPRVMPESAHLRGDRKTLVFISDESSTVPFHLAPHYRHIFKAYLPHETSGTNVHAFSLGCVKDCPELTIIPFDQRGIGVFFCGNLNEPRFALYRELHPLLRRLPAGLASLTYRLARRLKWPPLRMDFSDRSGETRIRFSGGFKAGLTPHDYAATLTQSKIVLCPRGFQSAETFRHMEAMRAGAVVISEPLPSTWMYEGSPIIQVPRWREGLRVAADLLSRPDQLRELHNRTVRWWQTVCSERAVAKHLAGIIGERRHAGPEPQRS